MKTLILVIAMVLVLIAAVAVKLFFFPAAKDAWFAMDRGNLLKVPPGLIIFRPTHFHDNFARVIIAAPYQYKGQDVEWFMGRNLPLRIAVAVAYGVNRATVVLPSDAPTNNFDFLLTTLDDPPAGLKAAISHKLGLVAHKETRDTPVLAIKVTDPSAMTVNDSDGKPDVNFKKGELYFTHWRINYLTAWFERTLDTPVVDETGLTNSYDFSMPWDGQTRNRIRFEKTSRAAIDKMLNKAGLTLQPDNAPVEMLVVTHASSL